MTTRPTMTNTRGAKSKYPPPRIQRPCMSQPITTTPVTVNDCNNCRPKGPTTTWEGILSARSKSKSAFSSSVDDLQLEQFNTYLYDPVHVLGFLFSELKTRLQLAVPDDKNVHKILSEIQQTMKRLAAMAGKTPLTASSCNLVQGNQEHRVKRHNSSCQTDQRSIHSLLLHEKASQTEVGFSGLDRFMMEAQIKQSHEKLKENCDALEKACAALQDEKYSIHDELCRCHDEIALLKTEVSYLQTELKETTSREKCITQDLEEQCRHLQVELKSLQDFLSKQKAELAVVESLSEKLKESSEKISLLERSRLENDKILVFTQLEKEKLMVLQKFRENQMESLQRDIAEVYKLLKEQLAGIHFGIGARGCGDPGHEISSQAGLKNPSHHKSKIDLSPAPASYVPASSGMASNFENNLPSESFQRETKSRKMHRAQPGANRSFHFAGAPDAACDLFSKEAITLNDHYPECGGEDKAELSSSPACPKNREGEFESGKQRQETAGSYPTKAPALNKDAKKRHHRSNEPPPLDYFYSRRKGGDKKSKEDLHHPERRASAANELSDFDEFKRLLDDVIPPSPPRPFKCFSTSSSADASFDLSQVNSSNG